MGFEISNFDTARRLWTCSQNLRFLLSYQKQHEHQSENDLAACLQVNKVYYTYLTTSIRDSASTVPRP